MLDYSPFWKTCKEKGISQYDLINMGIDRSILQRIRKGKTPNDIVTFVKDE